MPEPPGQSTQHHFLVFKSRGQYERRHLFATKLNYTDTTYYNVGALSRLDYFSRKSCHSISFRLL